MRKKFPVSLLKFIVIGLLCIAAAPECQTGESRLRAEEEQAGDSVPDFEKLSWLEGAWISEPPAGEESGDSNVVSEESWKRIDARTLEGHSYTIKQGDTVFTEKLRLEQNEEGIFYIATVPHNPGPVYFKSIRIEEDEAVFENPAHDFPNRIIYRRERGEVDTLHARIEGMRKGRESAVDFWFTRR